MFGVIFSALNSLLGFVFRTVVIKFAVFFGLWFVVTAFIPVLKTLLPNFLNIAPLFDNLPDGVIYFLNLAQFNHGFSLCVSAFITRFIIRRIPVIG